MNVGDETLYAIYKNPADYPGKFVVRQWWPGMVANLLARAVVDTLEEAREKIPLGFVNVGRMEQDDPVIFEVWCTPCYAEQINRMR